MSNTQLNYIIEQLLMDITVRNHYEQNRDTFFNEFDLTEEQRAHLNELDISGLAEQVNKTRDGRRTSAASSVMANPE